jgi:hypothetical protein
VSDRWAADRPHTLVVACSDGRLQEPTDAFFHHQLGLAGFDRFVLFFAVSVIFAQLLRRG